MDFTGQQALPLAVGNFLQVGIGEQHGFTRRAECRLGGGLRAQQRRSHRTGNRQIGQAGAQRRGLGLANGRQRDVDLALVAAFGVPRRFAMAGKQDAHAA